MRIRFRGGVGGIIVQGYVRCSLASAVNLIYQLPNIL